MLSKAGLTAYPIVLSTRDNGFVRETFPLLSQFNYTACAVLVDGKYIVLDATHKSLPPGVLPRNCLNGKGLVINGKGNSWIDLSPTTKSRTVAMAELHFDEEGEAVYSLSRMLDGYYAHESRASYLRDGEDAYVKTLLADRDWEIRTKSFEAAEDITKPFVEKYEVATDEGVVSTGDVLYIDPMLLNAERENPFKLEKREYPVDFGYPFEKTLNFKVKVPQGYTIEEVPKPKVFVLPDKSARYILNTAVNGDVITVTSILTVNKAIYTQLEYPNLREFYNQVVASQSGQIVLKKL